MDLLLENAAASYVVGDVLAGVFDAVLSRGEDPVDLTDATVAAFLTPPAGAGTTPFAAVVVDPPAAGAVEITAPAVDLDTAGTWNVTATVTYADGAKFTSQPAPLFVLAVADQWISLSQVRAEWRDAPSSDVVLSRLLSVARAQVIAYGQGVIGDEIAADGRPADPATFDRYLSAQLAQARNLWQKSRQDPASTMGNDAGGFSFDVFPLDWHVKRMIRPTTGKPVLW